MSNVITAPSASTVGACRSTPCPTLQPNIGMTDALAQEYLKRHQVQNVLMGFIFLLKMRVLTLKEKGTCIPLKSRDPGPCPA